MRSGSYLYSSAIPTSGSFTLVFFYRPQSTASTGLTFWNFPTTQGTTSWQWSYISNNQPPGNWNGVATRTILGGGELWAGKGAGWLSANTWYRCAIIWNGTNVIFQMDGSTLTNSTGSGTPNGNWYALGGSGHSQLPSHSSSQADVGGVISYSRVLTSSEINAISAPS